MVVVVVLCYEAHISKISCVLLLLRRCVVVYGRGKTGFFYSNFPKGPNTLLGSTTKIFLCVKSLKCFEQKKVNLCPLSPEIIV